MATITSTGVGSGIDINSLIDNIITTESEVKEKVLAQKETLAKDKISAYGRVKSSLEDFQSSLKDLKDLSKFQQRKATVTNSTAATNQYFTATANSTAIAASYDIEVQQVATASKLTSKAFSSESSAIGTGNLNITVDGVTTIVAIDNNNSSLFEIKKAINNADAGVVATSLIADDGAKLIITSKETGVEHAITITVTNDGDGNNTNDSGLSQLINANMTEITALDAIVRIDLNTVTRSSNTITGALDGITINVKEADVGNQHKLTVSLDKDQALSYIDKFIESYNKVLDVFNDLSGLTESDEEDLDSSESSESSSTKDLNAILMGDSTLRGIENQFQNIINALVGGAAEFRTLSQIGIVSNFKTGKLEKNLNPSTFNEKLTEALEEDFDSVGRLFGDSTYGVAKRLDDYLNDLLSSTGSVQTRVQMLNKDINNVVDNRAKLIKRLENLEELLLKKFTAMDALVANLRNTGSFLSETLKPLNKPSNDK